MDRHWKTQLRPSPSLVISCIALFVAMSGTAVALKGHNTVDSGDLKPNSVKNADIAPDAVGADNIGRHTIVTGNLADSLVSSDKLGQASVTTQALRDGAVRGSKLADIHVVSVGGFIGGSTTIKAPCPANSRLISGGSAQTPAVTITSDQPSLDGIDPDTDFQGDNPTAWSVTGQPNGGGGFVAMRAYALCLD
jgi:hypothetical protein